MSNHSSDALTSLGLFKTFTQGINFAFQPVRLVTFTQSQDKLVNDIQRKRNGRTPNKSICWFSSLQHAFAHLFPTPGNSYIVDILYVQIEIFWWGLWLNPSGAFSKLVDMQV